MGRKAFLEIVQEALDLAEKNKGSKNARARAVAEKLNAVSRKMLNLFSMENEIMGLNSHLRDRSGLLATGQYLEAILAGMPNSPKAIPGKSHAAKQDALRDLVTLDRIASSYVRDSNVRLQRAKRMPPKSVSRKARKAR